MNTVTIQTRVDAKLKEQAEKLYSSIGLDMTSAIRLFLTQSVVQRKIPFESIAPMSYNAETVRALEETEAILDGKLSYKSYDSIEEAMKDLACADKNS